MDCIKTLETITDSMISNFHSEMGELSCHDIKEASEAIHYNMESIYYATVTKAMQEASEEDRMGYRGRDSMGRYTSKSGYSTPRLNGNWEIDTHGKMGFKPMVDQEPYVMDYISDYGKEYDEWQDAKRHYTETKSISDKIVMDNKTKKHLKNMIDSVSEMLAEADPQLRQSLKQDVLAFANQM